MDNSIVLLKSIIIVNCATMDFVSNKLSADGYKNEVHSVITADKYILKLHRIPSTNLFKKPVVMVHGLGASSSAFVVTAAGFKLADHGYDVWLINVSGTDYSNHQNLLPTSSQYWNFSLDEMVKYDLPAIIDYVLIKTSHASVHCIAHSQGTTIVMAMLSLLPRYNKKLKTLHLMAPSVYFSNAAPLLKTAVMFSDPLEDAFAAVGINRTPPINIELEKLVGYLCSSKSIMTMAICKQLIFAIVGPSQHFNQDVERLIQEFKPWTIGIDKISGYNHFDFFVAKNVDEAVNTKILALMHRYCN